MPRSANSLALAVGFSVSTLRSPRRLPTDGSSGLSVPPLPSSNLGDERHDLRGDQAAVANLVPGDLSARAQQGGVSALALKRELGVSYNTAWLLKQKLMQAMKERDERRRLSGWVQVDDAVWGGERHGGECGRNAPGKTPFVAAVACNQAGHPLHMRLSRIDNVRHVTLARWARRHLEPGTQVGSDGLIGLRGVCHAGVDHEVIVTGGGVVSATHPRFHWVNTMLGNVKNALRGTYHGLRSKHLPRYLAEFSYRFNRRFALVDLVPRLAYAATHTPPLPYRLATLAESYG